MSKEQKRDFSDVEYRFSFALTISDVENKGDDIIICKRDFNIYNLDEESLCSIELKECIDDVVTLIDSDLKSKSRVYTWYNYDENYVTPEFVVGTIPENMQTMFKFTLFDNNKPIIAKGWSGDGYPFPVRNSVDITNRKFKYENTKNIEMDFVKQIAQKGSAGRPDLTNVIMRHISSTCASYKSRQNNNKLMYKQFIPEINIEIASVDSKTGKATSSSNRLNHLKTVTDDNGYDKLVYEVYNTTYKMGNVEYNLAPNSETNEY